VHTIAADDCVLFMWATVPMLPQALAVMVAWGFEYRTNFVWGKNKIATGYWNRNKHEQLLVGVKGNVPAPAMGTQWDSLINSNVRGHSVKPDWQYDLIEAFFPTLPKIELNARRHRPGWEFLGVRCAARRQLNEIRWRAGLFISAPD
jgi:N6-adenosine-specific RNA methylase IME4